MANIGIGINENVVIAGAAINDKKRLVLSLKTVSADNAPKSLFDEALTAGVVASSSDKLDLNIFGPLVSKKDDKTAEEKALLVHGDLIKLRNQLTQLLEQFMTHDKIDLAQQDIQFANINGMTPETYAARIIDQDVATRIYDNICNRFVELIKPWLNNVENSLRVKLVRQSKDKHYATIPGRYLDSQPWVELMVIPADQSRVKFSSWEISEGLDKSEPVAQAAAEAKPDAAPVETNPFAPQT